MEPKVDLTSKEFVGLATLIQSATITFLRDYFKALKTVDLKYSPNIARQDIAILGEFPRKQIKYPVIVVSIPKLGDLYQRVIGRELYKPLYTINKDTEKKNLSGYEVGGVFSSGFDINVACESTGERRTLLDFLAIIMRTIAPSHLHQKHIDIASIKIGAGREELIGNDLIYWDVLNIGVQTEWKQIVYNLPLVTDVNVEEVKPVEK